jgi:hypothetical protein
MEASRAKRRRDTAPATLLRIGTQYT